MFIEKVEEELKKKQITMNKLAKEIGYSQSATSQWKKGRMPQIDVLQKICNYLNVSADYLLDLDTGQPPDTLSETEKRLLQYFRRIDDDVGKDLVLEVAKREASRYGPPKEKETEEKLSNSKVG